MQTHKAKRVAIIIEQVMQSRLTDALTEAGVTGWTILPVLGGSGRSGEWSREGQISRGAGMVQVICIIRPEPDRFNFCRLEAGNLQLAANLEKLIDFRCQSGLMSHDAKKEFLQAMARTRVASPDATAGGKSDIKVCLSSHEASGNGNSDN